MTGIVAMPIYGKTLKKFLLRNPKFSDLETWHAALRTQALQMLYERTWPFYANVKFGRQCIWIFTKIIYVFENKYTPLGVCPCLGVLYMLITITFKVFLIWDRFTNERHIYVEPLWEKGTSNCKISLVTWPKWPPCPYMVKTPRTQINMILKLACSIWDSSSTKWWPWFNLDLF